MVLNIDEFTLNPTNELFTFEYSVTVEQYFEEIENYITVDPFPEWLTFNNETM